MADQSGPKLGLKVSGRLELHQKLIITPRIIRTMSDEEAEKRLFLPPKKKQDDKKDKAR